MRLFAIISLSSLTALTACKPTVEWPSESRVIMLTGSPPQVICRVKAVARKTGLSFHYGHNQTNDIVAFRLIGNHYEIEAVNFTGTAEYDVRLYDRSKDSAARLSAKQRFVALTGDLKRSDPSCRTGS